VARREQRIDADRADASYPTSGVSAYSRESARPGGSPYAPHIRAQELSARQLIPITIAKLREMESRMTNGTPELRKRMVVSFDKKRAFLQKLIKESNAT
jgi:hypothetical protein